MSPNTAFRPDQPLDSPIVERILADPEVIHDVGEDNVVLAARSEMIVHRPQREAADELHRALGEVAAPAGAPLGAAGEIEVWRLGDSGRNSIDEARRLRALAPGHPVRGTRSGELHLPAVSPNHLCIVSWGHLAGCPAGPPQPVPEPLAAADFIGPLAGEQLARVTVLDTGYIRTEPPHAALDARVSSVAGVHLDRGRPPQWAPDLPDEITTDREGRLHGIVGHGTFVAGLIAHLCPAAALTVVGQRDEDVSIDGTPTRRLYASEAALAHSLLTHADADVLQVGFAFPTLDDHPSIPFAHVMDVLSGPDAPRRGVAVVAPAGNESSARPHWPAALPGVIGVAATNRRGRSRARFSNWGAWLECCARGEDVVSTYIHWSGPVEGERIDEIERFAGWARWDGTSFAAPKVSAAIARLVAADPDGALLPTDAFARIVAGQADVPVTPVTDHELSGLPGVTLPQLHIH